MADPGPSPISSAGVALAEVAGQQPPSRVEAAAVAADAKHNGAGGAVAVAMPPAMAVEAPAPVVSDNSASAFRVLCVLTMAFNLVFTIDVFVMVGLRGRDGTDLQSQYSPTLFVFAFVQAASYLYCCHDCVVTFRGTADRTRPLDWDWQHQQFKRVCLPLAVNVLLVIPEIFTFVLQSRGDEFFKLLRKSEADGGMDDTTFFRVVMHIVSFGVLVLASAGAFALTKYALDNGLFAKDRHPETAASGTSAVSPSANAAGGSGSGGADANTDDTMNAEAALLARGSALAVMGNKIVALTMALAVVWYGASLVLGCTDETNSGIVLFTILCLAPALVAFAMSLQLMFRTALPKNWWLTYRSVTAVLVFVGYLSFWVILLLYTLLRVNSSDPTIPADERRGGFWVTVARQTPKRSSLVYVHLAMFFAYCVVTSARIYWCKLRKANRQPRVFRVDPHHPPPKKKLDVAVAPQHFAAAQLNYGNQHNAAAGAAPAVAVAVAAS